MAQKEKNNENNNKNFGAEKDQCHPEAKRLLLENSGEAKEGQGRLCLCLPCTPPLLLEPLGVRVGRELAAGSHVLEKLLCSFL